MLGIVKETFRQKSFIATYLGGIDPHIVQDGHLDHR